LLISLAKFRLFIGGVIKKIYVIINKKVEDI